MPVLLDRADGKSGLVQLLLLAAREIIEAVHGHLRWCEGVHCRAMWDADRVTAPSISLSFINMRKASASRGSSITTLVPPDTSVSTARSEEHTSELQSLMRIPYAVFCLKKKNITKLTNS